MQTKIRNLGWLPLVAKSVLMVVVVVVVVKPQALVCDIFSPLLWKKVPESDAGRVGSGASEDKAVS